MTNTYVYKDIYDNILINILKSHTVQNVFLHWEL